jgi:endonuclease/exonuclease/phosphatase family metal-dependent hydrolase
MGRLGIAALVAAVVAGCAAPVRMTTTTTPTHGCRVASDAAVTWVHPVDPGERAALDHRCAQVAPPLVRLGSVPLRPAARVVIATWNMHDGRGDVLALARDLASGAGEPPPDAVILLLQEVVRATAPARAGDDREDTGVRDVPAVIADLGWHLAYVPGKRNRREPAGAAAADRGTALLSTLPLNDLAAIELPVERQRRVALSGHVQGVTPDGHPWRLRLVSVHLENRSGARRAWVRAGASRTRQAEALVEALGFDAHAPGADDNGVVLGGDLNTWLGDDEQALRLLRETFPQGPPPDPRPTMRNGWRLDHVFVRLPPDVTATHRRLDSMYGSDHYPVVTTLAFGAR